MLPYSEFPKTKVSITMSLSDWNFISRQLRMRARFMNECEFPQSAMAPFVRIADEIDKETDKIIYGEVK